MAYSEFGGSKYELMCYNVNVLFGVISVSEQELYRKLIIEEIEIKLKELYKCYYSKNIIHRIKRKYYKDEINWYERLYLDHLKLYSYLLKDDTNK